jgi:hypothetical protein
MKKLLIAVALMTAFAAHAENWVRVTDSDTEDLRLFVDVDSFQAAQFEDKSPYIGAVFQYVKNGNPQGAIAYLTSPVSCKTNGGKMIARVQKEGKWETVANHIWADDGARFYDHVGGALCSILEVKMDKSGGKKPAKPAPGNV